MKSFLFCQGMCLTLCFSRGALAKWAPSLVPAQEDDNSWKLNLFGYEVDVPPENYANIALAYIITAALGPIRGVATIAFTPAVSRLISRHRF